MATVGGNLFQRTRCLYFRDAAMPCNKRRPGSGCPAQEGQNRMAAIFGTSEHCISAYPGDMANALLVLDAELEITGPNGDRRLSIGALHREPGDRPDIETVLEPGEIVTAILLPRSAHAANSHYVKVRDRASFEWPVVSAAAAVAVENGTVKTARVAAGGVGSKPWRLPEVERLLQGRALNDAAAITAGEAAGNGADYRPGNAFKVKLLQRAVTRVLCMAGGVE
jgi:xanthine dehydrogenase YagS FAD-binding subunit